MITIRKANETDISFCTALESNCFSEPWSCNAFIQSLDADDTYFFIAELDEYPVGYYVAGNICDEVNLYTIAVEPSTRTKGIGSRLVEHLIATANSKNAVFIGLEVRKSNTTAIGLYEKFGFILSGTRKGFYRKPNEDALLYTLYLNEDKL